MVDCTNNATKAPHMSPHSARAVGLHLSCDSLPIVSEPEPEPKPEPTAAAPDARGWKIYLPTKFEEGSGEPVEFPVYGWQTHVQKTARRLGIAALEIREKEKTGQDLVICMIMQPYHLYREFYLGRMNNRNCWATKFFGLPDLCEKINMARYLRNLEPLLGESSPLLQTAPRTFVLPAERAQLDQWFKMKTGPGLPREGKTFPSIIVKPKGGSKGKGIFITQSLAEIPPNDDVVAQEYIGDPLLLGGLKFDLRIYVVVVGLGEEQRAFIVNEGLVRFCTKPYEKPRGTIRYHSTHLTT